MTFNEGTISISILPPYLFWIGRCFSWFVVGRQGRYLDRYLVSIFFIVITININWDLYLMLWLGIQPIKDQAIMQIGTFIGGYFNWPLLEKKMYLSLADIHPLHRLPPEAVAATPTCAGLGFDPHLKIKFYIQYNN